MSSIISQFACKLNILQHCRRAKEDAITKEESEFNVRVEKSLENLREKMERELEDKKLELLEVKPKKNNSFSSQGINCVGGDSGSLKLSSRLSAAEMS